MENELPNRTTNQLLIQHIPDAAVFTDTSFIITACNRTAAALFNYSQHDVVGLDISFLIPTSSESNNPIVPLKNAAFTQGIITHVNKAGKHIPVHITRHAIAPGSMNGGFLFIYKTVDQEQSSSKNNGSPSKTEQALQQIEERHRLLSDHLLNIRETERTNIAREIHDELGQQLTILKMDVSWLHQKLRKYEDAAVLQKTSDTLKVLNETIRTVRRIATELRPSMLDDLGLIEAIEWQSKEFEKRSGIQISFESTIPHLPVANSIATSLFRIYQEALTNIGRHANAKHVYSKLQLENDNIILIIKDDGIGFDIQTLGVKKTLGLLGMKERTLMMGGRFEINSKAGEGTTIVITTFLQLEDTAETQTDQ
ncbi:MAG TPA: histidine kinase [Niastella sp.]